MKKSLPSKSIFGEIKHFLKSDWAIVIFLLALTGFLNFWRLSEIPAALNNDMAITAAEGKWIANHIKDLDFTLKGIPYLYPAFPRYLFVGSLSMQVFLYALVFLIFPVHQLTIHGFTAFMGTIEVIPFYFLAKKLFNKHLAFWGSFFYFTSPWHLIFARSGGVYYLILSITLLVILWLLAYVLTGYSEGEARRISGFFAALRMTKKNILAYLIIGLLLGLQIANGYPLFIITPILIFLILLRNRWRHLLYLLLTAVIAGLFFIGWSYFFTHLVDFSFFYPSRTDTNSVWIIYRLIKNHFFVERFSQQTDLNLGIKDAWERLFQWLFVASDRSLDLSIWRIRGYPLLQWPFSILMLIGFIFSLLRVFKRGEMGQKGKRGDKIILLWFALTILLFGIKVIPSERYLWIGLPAMALLAGRGFEEIERRVKREKGGKRGVIVLATIIYLIFFSWRPYFVTYAHQDGNEPTTYANQQIADFLKNNFSNGNDIFIIAAARLSALPFLTEFRYDMAGWRGESSTVDWPALENVLKNSGLTDDLYVYDLGKVNQKEFMKTMQKAYDNDRFAFIFNFRTDLYLYDPTAFSVGKDVHKEFKKIFPELKPALEIKTSLGEPGILVYVIDSENEN